MTAAVGLPYYGGKSPRHAANRWIASLLPPGRPRLYVECFAGMLGVLLQRQPAGAEIVNDADRLVVNWWRIVRDRPEDLADRLEWTPTSRAEFLLAHEMCETGRGDPLTLAWAFTVLTTQSIGNFAKPSAWRRRYNEKGGHRRGSTYGADLLALRDRIVDVQLECDDAVKLLRRLTDDPHAVIYADPPYRHANNTPYRAAVDHPELVDALLAQTGAVAVSGYPGDMPELEAADWRRFTLAVSYAGTPGLTRASRTECLWTNYDPPQPAEDPRHDLEDLTATDIAA